MNNRGVGSYWLTILEKNYLESEVIIEMDFRACFNNIRKLPLLESLTTKYGVPQIWVCLLYAHINAEIETRPLSELPSLDGMLERYMNKDFDLKSRNLIQGLPISPLLCNIAVKNVMDSLIKELGLDISRGFKYLTYADDISLYLTKKEFNKLGGENFITTLNSSNAFKKHGFQIDKEKSEVVKNGE